MKGEAKLDLFSTPGSKRHQVDRHDEKMVPQVQKSPVSSKTRFLKSKYMNTQDFQMNTQDLIDFLKQTDRQA